MSLTLPQLFYQQVSKYGRRCALMYKTLKTNCFGTLSWDDWGQGVEEVALGLYAMRLGTGDRIAILAENSPEWTFSDLGSLSIGAANVPIYSTLPLDDIAYILEHSQAKVLFVSTDAQILKIKPYLEKHAELKVIRFQEESAYPHLSISLKELRRLGRRQALNHSSLLSDLIKQVQGDDLATIIYTSGTTGNPKGVMLTHENFIQNYEGSKHYIEIKETDISLSFLPLSHVFERLAGYYFMMAHGAVIAYAESMLTVADDIQKIKPTVAAAVPRFYEKVHSGILQVVQSSPAVLGRLFRWSEGVAQRYTQCLQEKRPLPMELKVQHALADRLIFRILRKRLGSRIRFFISGGAPLNHELGKFFYAAGVTILEGYGLTETSPVIAVNTINDIKFGTVGRPIPNVEVKLANDGEILTRGPCIMKGYFNDDAATRESIRDGWFYTGDIGAFDEGGFLKITDRKKDIIVTSGGKNIAPQKIEKLILSDCLFKQVVVLGDKRNYLVALIVPDEAQVKSRAVQLGFNDLPYPELLKKERIYKWLFTRLWEKTKHLPSFEQIKHFASLERELSLQQGELTPTLKIKRRIVMEKYSEIIDRLYQKEIKP